MTVTDQQTQAETKSPKADDGSFVVSLFKKGDARSETTPGPKRPQQRRRRWLALSFVICVLLPSVAGTWYYTAVASDRYVAGAGFAVRGMNGGGMDVIGSFTGLAGTGSTTSDSYIVLKYLKSRDLLDRLQQDFDFRAAFSGDNVDRLSRLDPTADIEKAVDYWDGMIQTSFDPSTGIITFDVQAFSAEEAKLLSELVLEYARALVNKLSENARKDAVQYAEEEVDRAAAGLREAMLRMRAFREEERSLDPNASAQLQIELLGGLERQLLDIRARISELDGRVDDNAPSLMSLRRQARVLEEQIAEKNDEISTATGGVAGSSALSGLLAEYETLEIEKNFAQQSYASALASLENARVEADRQQRYLAIYSVPALPEYPLYPQRALNILMLVVGFTCLWGIGTLIVYSVRDHLS